MATDDVIRSLAISQRLLGTREIALVHHTGCGMATFRDEDLACRIEADCGVRPPFALEAFPEPETGVRRSLARILASPFLPHRDAVRGYVYDLEAGRLREVSRP